MFRLLGCVCMSALSAVGCQESVELEPFAPGPGKVTILDSGGVEGDTGWWPSLAIDKQDRPHLSYCDAHRGDLRYATKQNRTWKTEMVVSKGAVGKYTALAVDSKGTVGIAFYDQDIKYLRYAWRTADPDAAAAAVRAAEKAEQIEPGENGWLTERVAWGLEIGMAAELRFDGEDVPHLFYYIPSGRLAHAFKPHGGEWTKEVVSEAVGSFTVRIDPVIRPDGIWLSFIHWTFKDIILRLAKPSATPRAVSEDPLAPSPKFDIEDITEEKGPGWRSQLIFYEDELQIVYTLSREPQIRLGHRGPDGWESRLLLPGVANFAARLAKDGDLVVAYEDVHRGTAGKGIVRLLRLPLGDPKAVPTRYHFDPDGPTGAYLALALSSEGKPLIAYYAGDIRGLKVYDETDL